MKLVKAANILYYYDGPHVIEARDTIGGHYIAVLAGSEQERDRYLVVGVAPERCASSGPAYSTCGRC